MNDKKPTDHRAVNDAFRAMAHETRFTAHQSMTRDDITARIRRAAGQETSVAVASEHIAEPSHATGSGDGGAGGPMLQEPDVNAAFRDVIARARGLV